MILIETREAVLGNMENVFLELAKHKDKSPASPEVQNLISKCKSCLEEFMVALSMTLIILTSIGDYGHISDSLSHFYGIISF